MLNAASRRSAAAVGVMLVLGYALVTVFHSFIVQTGIVGASLAVIVLAVAVCRIAQERETLYAVISGIFVWLLLQFCEPIHGKEPAVGWAVWKASFPGSLVWLLFMVTLGVVIGRALRLGRPDSPQAVSPEDPVQTAAPVSPE